MFISLITWLYLQFFHNGSKHNHLLEMALEIYVKCHEFDVHLDVEWRPRENYFLEIADAGSKSFDTASFSPDFASFAVVVEYFNDVPIQVDAMSEYWNKKSNFYYSKRKDPFSSGVNFFVQRLDSTVSYCHYHLLSYSSSKGSTDCSILARKFLLPQHLPGRQTFPQVVY